MPVMKRIESAVRMRIIKRISSSVHTVKQAIEIPVATCGVQVVWQPAEFTRDALRLL